ncbi:zinc finger protein 862-like isoform X2 [Ptychodera flava]|uniref:zinc finger protein 862-like isoform X2 n=1 Tax=Ptychodera flava TaxID=63121 RepID=UPI00396A40A1
MVSATKDKLKQILSDNVPINKFVCDIDSFTNISSELGFQGSSRLDLESLMRNYIGALIENIDNRFAESSPVLTALSVFDPLSMPSKDNETFSSYGQAHIKVLADHFYQNEEVAVKESKTQKLVNEFTQLKYYYVDYMKANMPTDVEECKGTVTPTQWLLTELVRCDSLTPFFPEITKIAEAALCVPVSNAWPERGASTLKNVKTRLRSRLSSEMLESILHVSINGPPVASAEAEQIISLAVEQWEQAKSRRYRTKVQVHAPCVTVDSESVSALASDGAIYADASVQVDIVETEEEQVSIQNEILKVSAALGLPEEYCSSDPDSDFEFD